MTEMTPVGLAAGLAVTEFVSGVALAWVGAKSRHGTLALNRYAGFRTRSTMASDGHWRAAHLAGGGALLMAALPQVAAGVAIATRPPLAALPFIAGGGVLLMVVAVTVGARRAVAAAAGYERDHPTG